MPDELVVINREPMVKRLKPAYNDFESVKALRDEYKTLGAQMLDMQARRQEIKAILESVALSVEEQVKP